MGEVVAARKQAREALGRDPDQPGLFDVPPVARYVPEKRSGERQEAAEVGTGPVSPSLADNLQRLGDREGALALERVAVHRGFEVDGVKTDRE